MTSLSARIHSALLFFAAILSLPAVAGVFPSYASTIKDSTEVNRQAPSVVVSKEIAMGKKSRSGQDATGCVSLDSKRIVNGCTSTVEVHWCTSRPGSCDGLARNHGVGGEAVTLKPQRGYSSDIPDGGTATWVACFSPFSPANWRGPGTTFTCKDNGDDRAPPSGGASSPQTY